MVSVTAAKLFPGILLGLDDDPDVVEIKGRATMADLLSKAVKDRQRRPKKALQVWYGAGRVVLALEKLNRIFDRSLGYRTHNEGAQAFRRDIIDALSAEVYDPSFHNVEDANETFSNSSDVNRFVLRHWPNLTPEQALNDLLGSHALLRSAASSTDLSAFEVSRLHRKRTSEADFATLRWSDADVPLLDELLFLLGGRGLNQIDERDIERDEADEFMLATEQEEAESDDDDLDDIEEVSLDDPLFNQQVFYGRAELGSLEDALSADDGPRNHGGEA